MKYITFSDMQQQSDAAARSPRLHSHIVIFTGIADPRTTSGDRDGTGTYDRPHRRRTFGDCCCWLSAGALWVTVISSYVLAASYWVKSVRR